MAELNQYNMYNILSQNANAYAKDKVDECVDAVIKINMYKEIKNFVKENFGDVNGVQWFEYPELKKSVYVRNEPEKVEICTFKNDKQYYGKGWIPYKKEE